MSRVSQEIVHVGSEIGREFLHIGHAVGHALLGRSLAHMLILFYVLYYFSYLIQNERNFNGWKTNNLFGKVFTNINTFLVNVEYFIYVILFAVIISRTSQRLSLFGRISSSIGIMVFAFGIRTIFDVTKYAPQGNLNLWNASLKYIRERATKISDPDGFTSLGIAVILGYILP